MPAREDLSKLIKDIAESGETELSRSGEDLTDDDLAVLFPEIVKLTNLRTLSLSYSQLSEVPPDIANLTNLQSLNLSGNQLSELPAEIANLINLQELYFHSNQLSELTAKFVKLTSLQELDLSYDRLPKLPPDIGNLANLESPELNREGVRQVAGVGQDSSLDRVTSPNARASVRDTTWRAEQRNNAAAGRSCDYAQSVVGISLAPTRNFIDNASSRSPAKTTTAVEDNEGIGKAWGQLSTTTDRPPVIEKPPPTPELIPTSLTEPVNEMPGPNDCVIDDGEVLLTL